MKFNTFNELLQNCKELYETACARDRKLQEALGGDTQVMTEWWDAIIVNTITAIESEFGDKNETVSWLFWESMTNNSGYMDFEIDGVTYEGSPENIWMDLNGVLDERFCKHTDTCADELIENPDFDSDVNGWRKEDIKKAHDTDKLDPEVVKMILSDEVKPNEEWETASNGLKGSAPEIHITNEPVKPYQDIVQVPNPETDRKIEKLIEKEVEDETLKKLILLKDMQIQLESVTLSSVLENKVQQFISKNMDEFTDDLDREFNELLLDSKHKDTLTKIINQFRMVLMNFVGDRLDDKTMDMVSFEVVKVLNNLKEMKSIFDYKVEIKGQEIKGEFLWEDINNKAKKFNIVLNPELNIEFEL